jgi:putative thioredoxin
MFSFDVSSADFQKIVINGSRQVPVVVDFWAPWCGPCKVLKPILEKLAAEYQGKFILAKVNSDENQALAQQYGVRGIPSVKAFRDGQLVDEFSGALPESQVRAFLESLTPSPGEERRLQAWQSYQAGQLHAALSQLLEAQAIEPANERVTVDLARIYYEQGDPDKAKQLLNTVSLALTAEAEVTALVNQVNFTINSRDLPDAATLRQGLQADETNLDLRLQLANRYIVEQRYEEAMEQLLEIIRRDRRFQDDIGRKTMLSVFQLLPDREDLVRQYRRRMASLLS